MRLRSLKIHLTLKKYVLDQEVAQSIETTLNIETEVISSYPPLPCCVDMSKKKKKNSKSLFKEKKYLFGKKK
jgi:hypothetical protein